MKFPKTLTALVVFVFSFSVGPILNTPLEDKFPKDTKLEYKVSSEAKQEMTMMGQEQSSTINSTENIYVLGLDLVDDNNFKIEFYVDNINFTADNPQLNLQSLDFSFINNKKSSALVSKKGVVSSVEAIDVIELPEDPITHTLGHQYEPMKVISKLFFLLLPENDLKAGDTWGDSKTEVNAMGGDVTTVTDYSYTVGEQVDYKGYSCLEITCSIKITMSGQGAQMGQEFKISGKGKGDLVYYFAQDKGILVGYEINQVTNVDFDFIAMDMTIPSTNTTSYKVELVN
jgi:hypothetical protein